MGQAPDAEPGTGEPVRVLRPMVVPARFLVGGPIAVGFLAIFPGFFTFVLSNMIAMRFEPMFGPGLVAFGLPFAVILGLIGLEAFFEPGLTTYSSMPSTTPAIVS